MKKLRVIGICIMLSVMALLPPFTGTGVVEAEDVVYVADGGGDRFVFHNRTVWFDASGSSHLDSLFAWRFNYRGTSRVLSGMVTNYTFPDNLVGSVDVELSMYHLDETYIDTFSLDFQNLAYLDAMLLKVSGGGSKSNPYSISNVEELQLMNADLSAEYRLVNDIDASITSGWNGGEGFIPIGTSGESFTGSLYGDGYNISNLFINRSGSIYQSIFGSVDGSLIERVNIVGVDITGGGYTGGLIGVGSGMHVCRFINVSGSIDGTTNMGGLIGGGVVNASSIGVNVSVLGGSGFSAQLGGFAGRLTNPSVITDSYSLGVVTRKSGVMAGGTIGSFVGEVDGTPPVVISRSYAVGGVVFEDAADPTDKGFVGQETTVGTFEYNYFDNVTTGQISGIGASGRNTTDMYAEATFETWDFVGVWAIDEGNDYPYLLGYIPPVIPPPTPQERMVSQNTRLLETIFILSAFMIVLLIIAFIFDVFMDSQKKYGKIRMR